MRKKVAVLDFFDEGRRWRGEVYMYAILDTGCELGDGIGEGDAVMRIWIRGCISICNEWPVDRTILIDEKYGNETLCCSSRRRPCLSTTLICGTDVQNIILNQHLSLRLPRIDTCPTRSFVVLLRDRIELVWTSPFRDHICSIYALTPGQECRFDVDDSEQTICQIFDAICGSPGRPTHPPRYADSV